MGSIGVGTITALLLFGIGISLYLGSDGAYAPGFIAFLNSLEGNPADLFNLVMSNLGGVVLSSGLAATFAYITKDSATIGMMISWAVINAVSYILLMPLSFLGAVPMPYPLGLMALGFINLLWIITVISFVSGRDF